MTSRLARPPCVTLLTVLAALAQQDGGVRRSPLPVALTALALLPTAAAGQVTSAAEPNSTAAASRLTLGVDATSQPFGSRVPNALVLLLDRGFEVDLATPSICGDSPGQGGGCAPSSQVASGTAAVETSFAGGPPEQVNARIEVFRAQTPPTNAPADTLAGLIAIIDAGPGSRSHSEGFVRRVNDGPFGYEVRFDALAKPLTPFGTTVRLKRFDLDISASWRSPVTVTRTVKCKRSSRSRSCKPRSSCKRGRKCARYRKVRETRMVQHNLLHNPAQCNGTWASRTIATFDDGTSAIADAPIACTSR